MSAFDPCRSKDLRIALKELLHDLKDGDEYQIYFVPRPVLVALAQTVDRELSFRNHRRKCRAIR